MSRKKHFTLIELLAVMAVLVILMGIAITVMRGTNTKTLNRDCQIEIQQIEALLEEYHREKGYYPDGSTNTLTALISHYGSTSSKFKALTLNSGSTNFTDPFGNDYVYTCPGSNNTKTFDVASLGADGSAGTDDDLNNYSKQK